MSKVQAEAWLCDLCAHKWICGEKKPSHCAKCRKRGWDKGTPKGQRPTLDHLRAENESIDRNKELLQRLAKPELTGGAPPLPTKVRKKSAAFVKLNHGLDEVEDYLKNQAAAEPVKEPVDSAVCTLCAGRIFRDPKNLNFWRCNGCNRQLDPWMVKL